jgi:hypothetical protein
MKKSLFFIAFGVLVLLSCNKSSNITTYTEDCSGTAKSYTNDVSPIIQTYCTQGSSCHGSGISHGPGALQTYTQIFNARNSIYSSVSVGRMPVGTVLSNTQKNAILCWIDSGAPNN